MKKRLLSNRARNATLMTILLQSVIFGIDLVITGTSSGTTNRPYKVIRSQAVKKNSPLSNYMNNVLLLANTMEKELAKMMDGVGIQNRLVNNLNRASSSDGIFYANLDGREALVLRDRELDIHSSTYGDISCTTGRTQSSYPIALSKDWRPKLMDQEQGMVEQFWENKGSGGTWSFTSKHLYYVLSQESSRGRRIMGLEISNDMLDPCLELDNPPCQRMIMLLLPDESVHFSLDQTSEGTGYGLEEKTGYISLTNNGVGYDGVRSALQTYGYVYGGAIYVAAVRHHSELTALSQSAILMVTDAYFLSISMAITFSYIVIYMVSKPIRRLQKDIACQKPEEVHFRESSIVETGRIHRILNGMADKLEQSYSRYPFTVESAGDNVGNFECQEKGGRVKAGPFIRIFLGIPADSREPVNEIDHNGWSCILDSLEQIEGLKDGYASTDIYGDRRTMTIRWHREEHGVFGPAIDKADAYNEIVRLRNISQHDQLTGLYNPSCLKREGQEILDENASWVNALVLCDLNSLKYINDNFGREMGDCHPEAIADLLTPVIQREQCTVVRLSGDEFVLFFYGYDNRNVTEQKMRDGYAGRPSLKLPDGTDHRTNASIRLAYAQRGTGSMDNLLNCADHTMYRVKHGEKNDITIYDKSDEARLTWAPSGFLLYSPCFSA